jgi:hypothetical protein
MSQHFLLSPVTRALADDEMQLALKSKRDAFYQLDGGVRPSHIYATRSL